MSNWMLERTAQRLEAQRNAAEADVVALRAKVAELELALSVNPNSRWNAERDALKARVAQLEEAAAKDQDTKKELAKAWRRLEETLRWYADEANYRYRDAGDGFQYASHIKGDRGARARAALATKEGA